MFLEWEISGKLQNSGKLQKNAISDVKQISLSPVINKATGKTFNQMAAKAKKAELAEVLIEAFCGVFRN